jgi:hypothetical protein
LSRAPTEFGVRSEDLTPPCEQAPPAPVKFAVRRTVHPAHAEHRNLKAVRLKGEEQLFARRAGPVAGRLSGPFEGWGQV